MQRVCVSDLLFCGPRLRGESLNLRRSDGGATALWKTGASQCAILSMESSSAERRAVSCYRVIGFILMHNTYVHERWLCAGTQISWRLATVGNLLPSAR